MIIIMIMIMIATKIITIIILRTSKITIATGYNNSSNNHNNVFMIIIKIIYISASQIQRGWYPKWNPAETSQSQVWGKSGPSPM